MCKGRSSGEEQVLSHGSRVSKWGESPSSSHLKAWELGSDDGCNARMLWSTKCVTKRGAGLHTGMAFMNQGTGPTIGFGVHDKKGASCGCAIPLDCTARSRKRGTVEPGLYTQ
jgi:hypothetical protein